MHLPYLFIEPNWILDPSNMFFWDILLGKGIISSLITFQIKFLFFRDVIFHESIFSFSRFNSILANVPLFSGSHIPSYEPDPSSVPTPIPLSNFSLSSPSDSTLSVHSTPLSNSMSTTISPSTISITALDNLSVKKSTRLHNPPRYLEDYIYNSIILTNLTHDCFASHVSPTVLSFSTLSPSNQSLLNSVSSIFEPTSYSQVSLHSGWRSNG